MKRKLCLLLICLALWLLPSTSFALSDYTADFIFTNHGAAMLIIDPSTGDIIDANSAAVAFYGYSAAELRTMNIDQINTLTTEEIQAEMDAALSEDRSYFAFKHQLKDGTIKDVDVYSSPATDELGNPILMSIVHDITPQVEAQQDAQRSKVIIFALLIVAIVSLTMANVYSARLRRKEYETKRQYQNLFNNMKEGFALHEIICDEAGKPVDYRFLEINRAFEEITGISADQVKNRTVKEALPDTEQYWIDQYGDVALNGNTMSFENYSGALGKYFSVSVFSPKPKQFATIFSNITNQVRAKEEVESDRNLLETILEDALSGYWNWDLVNNDIYLSPSLLRMLGYESQHLGSTPETWRHLFLEEDLPLLTTHFQQHVDTHGTVPFYNEVRCRHKNGSVVWVICSGRVIEWNENTPLKMAGCHINITNMKKLEAELFEERSLFKTTLHSLGDAVISTDKDGNVDLMNAVAEDLTGWKRSEAKGLPFETVFHIVNEITGEKCPNPVAQVFKTGQIIELANHTMLIKKNGGAIPIEDSAAPIIDESGAITGVVLVFRDFTDKKEKQEKIRYLSNHDQLTTLYNRHFFESQLAFLDLPDNLPFTIIMADVNGLKLTNDAFGHKAGDALLKKVATSFKKTCRPTDILARIGGDEFVLLLPKTAGGNAEKIVARITDIIEQEKQDNIVISVSFGWDTKVSDDESITEILTKAEEHMYRKKLVESQSMRNQTIRVIMQTLQETNHRERIHAEKVSQICRSIGESMHLDSNTLKELETAALMHDIGKIALNETVLNKSDPLTESEFDEIKRHPEIGYHILKSADAYTNLADYILSHHERWDGRGYPRELSGTDIPLIGRIIAVADAYEAMTGDRPYRTSMTPAEALKEITHCAGTQFDPDIVGAFLKSLPDSPT